MNGIRHWKIFVFIGVVAIVGIIACGGVMTSICDNDSLQCRLKPSLLVFALVSFSGISLWFAKHRGLPLEWIFLAMFMPISIGMMWVMPVTGAPDEPSHLHRAYLVSSGQVFIPPDKATAPAGLFAPFSGKWTTYSLRNLKHDFCHCGDIRGPKVPSGARENTGVYPFFAYLPQATGMFVARQVSNNKFVMFYGARSGALLLVIAMFFLAVRLAPCGKNIILFISLLPMTLQESASAVVDGLAIACVTLLTALVLRSRVEGFLMARRHIVLCAFLSVGLVAFKVMYLPFAALFLFVPVEAFGGDVRRRRIFRCIVFGAMVASFAAWAAMSIVPLLGQASSRVSSMAMPRIKMVLMHPLDFAICILRTVMWRFENWLDEMIGMKLSWYNVPLARSLKYLVIALGGWVVCHDSGLSSGRMASLRVPLAICSLASFLVVLFALFVWWTEDGSLTVEGVQGRYYLPFLAALLLSLRRPRPNAHVVCPRLWGVYCLLLFVDVCTLMKVVAVKY